MTLDYIYTYASGNIYNDKCIWNSRSVHFAKELWQYDVHMEKDKQLEITR